VPIYVRITLNGLRDQFSSGKKIVVDHWNNETGFAIRACKDAASINAYINKADYLNRYPLAGNLVFLAFFQACNNTAFSFKFVMRNLQGLMDPLIGICCALECPFEHL
jgi:hypothetical protein